ncbi:MAG: G8 domain-containing protein, partial [Flavobacteriales bacterium]
MFPSAVCRLAGTLFVLLLLSFSVALANPVSAVADGHWNNPLTWEDGLVPGSSDQVTIPTGITVELSGTHSAQTLTVNGTLRAAGDASVDLSAEWIMVMGPGALFEVGTPGAPFPAEYDFTLTLTGANTGGSMMGMGEKFLGAMNGGQIELHGAPKVSWTRLGASSFLGANQLTLADPVDWQQGDEIVVVSSRINWAEAEQRTLNAVSADG